MTCRVFFYRHDEHHRQIPPPPDHTRYDLMSANLLTYLERFHSVFSNVSTGSVTRSSSFLSSANEKTFLSIPVPVKVQYDVKVKESIRWYVGKAFILPIICQIHVKFTLADHKESIIL